MLRQCGPREAFSLSWLCTAVRDLSAGRVTGRRHAHGSRPTEGQVTSGRAPRRSQQHRLPRESTHAAVQRSWSPFEDCEANVFIKSAVIQ